MKIFLVGIVAAAVIGSSTEAFAAPVDASETGSFKLKAVPESFLVRGPGMRSFIRFKAGEKPTGGTFSMGKRRLPYQFAYGTDGKAAEKIVIDWNGNKNFDDDKEVKLPEKNTPEINSFTLNGKEYKFALSAINRGNSIYLMLRPAEWLEGTIRIGDQTRTVALVDTGFDGLDTSGSDVLLMDVNGDGEIAASPRMEGLTPLTDSLMLPEGIYEFAFDKETQKVTLTPSTDVGRVVVDYPATWNKVSFNGSIRTASGYVRCPFTENAATLPTGTYGSIRLSVQGESDNGPFSLYLSTQKLTVTKGEATPITIEKPSGVVPKMRIVGNTVRVRESLAFDTEPMGGISMNYSMRVKGKRVPAPSVEIYKGDEKVVQAVMKYG